MAFPQPGSLILSTKRERALIESNGARPDVHVPVPKSEATEAILTDPITASPQTISTLITTSCPPSSFSEFAS